MSRAIKSLCVNAANLRDIIRGGGVDSYYNRRRYKWYHRSGQRIGGSHAFNDGNFS